MSKKNIGSKLADSLRQARDLPAGTVSGDVTPASTPAPTPKPARAAPPPPFGSYARQIDQSPAASLDRPWDNLHPERIWPD